MSESEEDFAAMLAQHEARGALEIGQMVKGRVIQISDEHVFVDVGGKGEAWIDRGELADDQGRLNVKVGDEVEATVVATGDEIRLSHRLRQGAQAREALAVAAQTGVPVEGKVAGVIKGGYEVTVGGLRAFCPFSQMELRRVESEQEYVGRVLEFRVTKYAEGGRNLVLSRRALLEEQAAKAAEQTRKKILPDAVLPGTVVSLADFGAFVDLGGVQGLVPMSELSHARVERASDRLRIGEAVTVKVLRIDDARGKVTLSLKALEGDPWATVPGRLRERHVVRGRAARATEFGVFVELLPGVDGLLHASEIPRHRSAALREAVTAGAEIAVMIVNVDTAKRRIALALAPEGATVGEEMASAVAVGAVLTGTVDRVEPFGVFVRLGLGQTGLVPNAELGTTQGADHRRMFPAGSEMKVLVLAIEEGGRRIRLSREKARAHEEQAEAQAYLRDATKKGGFGMTLGDLFKKK
ncbi:MAG: 30S ribosomal protein S1 [Candidatus Rokuibacteriota bacterium]|nr:MAG: 30S ribosomal protein S1 [Candidatus Rokubacteria bacterium]PYN26625.1 MAG: 30S ribosomal protein S1 [Candidatus Rokubacteria bacterium]